MDISNIQNKYQEIFFRRQLDDANRAEFEECKLKEFQALKKQVSACLAPHNRGSLNEDQYKILNDLAENINNQITLHQATLRSLGPVHKTIKVGENKSVLKMADENSESAAPGKPNHNQAAKSQAIDVSDCKPKLNVREIYLQAKHAKIDSMEDMENQQASISQQSIETTRHIEEEMKQAMERKLRSELTVSIRAALEKKIRAEVTSKIHDELAAEVRKQEIHKIRAEMAISLRPQIAAKIRKEVIEKVREELAVNIRQEVEEKVRVELEVVLRKELEAKIRDEVKKDTALHVKQETQVEMKARMEAESAAREKIELEVLEEVEATIRKELQSSLKAEIETKVRAELSETLHDEIEKEVRIELEPKLRREIEAKTKENLIAQVHDEVEQEVRESLEPELRNEIEARLKQQLHDEIELEVRNELRQTTSEISVQTAPVAKVQAAQAEVANPLMESVQQVLVKTFIRSFINICLGKDKRSAFLKTLTHDIEEAQAQIPSSSKHYIALQLLTQFAQMVMEHEEKHL